MTCIFCDNPESKDCIVCSRCSQKLLNLLASDKLEELYEKYVEKGYTEKANYIKEIIDGSKTREPVNRRFTLRTIRNKQTSPGSPEGRGRFALLAYSKRQEALFGKRRPGMAGREKENPE
jgi:hypothetical protein